MFLGNLYSGLPNAIQTCTAFILISAQGVIVVSISIKVMPNFQISDQKSNFLLSRMISGA